MYFLLKFFKLKCEYKRKKNYKIFFIINKCIYSVNTIGNSYDSSLSQLIATRPNPITNLSYISDISNNKLIINWEPPSYNGGEPITYYTINYSININNNMK
mgnify:CR=1 FL=1